MGAAISNNVSKDIVNTSYSIATSYVQTCQSANKATFNIVANPNCKAQNLGQLDIVNKSSMNANCLQNSTTENTMQSMIQDQIVAQATAAAQSIGGPSLSFASSLQERAENIAQSIRTLYTQHCVTNNTSDVNITCGSGATQTFTGISIDNEISTYNTCTADNATKNQFISKLSNLIHNETNAKEADTLGGFVIVILIVLAIIAFFFVKTLNGPIGWVIVIIVIAVIIGLAVYAAFAFRNGWYPFKRDS